MRSVPRGQVMGWPRSPGHLSASEGDWGLYPGTSGPCWTLAIGVLLCAWDKMVPTLPCLLLRSSTHRKPVEEQDGTVKVLWAGVAGPVGELSGDQTGG